MQPLTQSLTSTYRCTHTYTISLICMCISTRPWLFEHVHGQLPKPVFNIQSNIHIQYACPNRLGTCFPPHCHQKDRRTLVPTRLTPITMAQSPHNQRASSRRPNNATELYQTSPTQGDQRFRLGDHQRSSLYDSIEQRMKHLYMYCLKDWRCNTKIKHWSCKVECQVRQQDMVGHL